MGWERRFWLGELSMNYLQEVKKWLGEITEIALLLVALFYKEFMIISFDLTLARTLRMPTMPSPCRSRGR